jgi:DNA-binding LacI/PurR family transcriptional regulator
MVTIKDVARKAGVSHATVSYVLNGKAGQAKTRISSIACEQVKAAAEQLGYRRNEIARAMVTGRNDVIAFISCDTGAWEYTGKIMSGIMEEATQKRFAVKVYHLTHRTPDDIVRQLVEQRIAGIIFHSDKSSDFDLIRRKVEKKHIPCATVNLSSATVGIGVTSDDFQGTRQAVKHLAGLGHRRISYISDRSRMEFVVNRENGFAAGMKEHVAGSGRLQIIYCVSKSGAKNLPVIRRVLSKSKDNRPTAIICFTDYIACNVLQVAYQMGIKVPEDLSVIGFADLDVAEYATVPLTTVGQPFEQMGRETANMLIDAIKNKRQDILHKAENRKLEVKLVVRESTAVPKKF